MAFLPYSATRSKPSNLKRVAVKSVGRPVNTRRPRKNDKKEVLPRVLPSSAPWPWLAGRGRLATGVESGGGMLAGWMAGSVLDGSILPPDTFVSGVMIHT